MEKYILVTHFSNHWDDKKNTFYYPQMLKGNLSKNKVLEAGNNNSVVFIKINKNGGLIEHVWEGAVHNVIYDDGKIKFDIKIKNKNDNLKSQYSKFNKSGWYNDSIDKTETNFNNAVTNQNVEQLKEKDSINNPILIPPFFYYLERTKDWNDFENFTFLLLKLIGLNTLFKYPSDDNRGKADGFFKIRNTVVLYDTTLETNYLEKKETQITNFVNLLNNGNVKIGNEIIDTTNATKRVWIITQNKHLKIRIEKEVKVIEVTIRKLIELYCYRLGNNVSEEEMEQLIVNI